MGPELDRQELREEKEWLLKNTEPFMMPGSSASVCSSTLTLVALAVALLHNIIWMRHSDVVVAFTADLHIHITPYAVSTEQLYHTQGCTAI